MDDRADRIVEPGNVTIIDLTRLKAVSVVSI
jgi:hypothetical protein